jgi:hypothetical protein
VDEVVVIRLHGDGHLAGDRLPDRQERADERSTVRIRQRLTKIVDIGDVGDVDGRRPRIGDGDVDDQGVTEFAPHGEVIGNLADAHAR